MKNENDANRHYDEQDLLDTLRIKKRTGRAVGGTWVSGTIAGLAFEALVFPEHAGCGGYEMGDSRISQFWLKDPASPAPLACFDRGWEFQPADLKARAVVDLLSAGLAELVFGR